MGITVTIIIISFAKSEGQIPQDNENCMHSHQTMLQIVRYPK